MVEQKLRSDKYKQANRNFEYTTDEARQEDKLRKVTRLKSTPEYSK